MKMPMRRLLPVLALLSVLSSTASAQAYKTALGIRLGTEMGLTLNQRIARTTTLEGILQSSFLRPDFQVHVLAKQHFPLLSRGFNVFAGAGLHTGWYEGVEDNYRTQAGISLMAGAELTLGRLNFSWDIKPAIALFGGTRWWQTQSAFSLRYVLVKRDARKQGGNWKFWEKGASSDGKKRSKRSGRA